MVVLKSAITSFNITIQKVNRNEKVLAENLQRLNKIVVDEINRMQTQLDSVLILKKNIQQVQRGLDECQHTFSKICDKHYEMFRETDVIKELILCMLHYIEIIILYFCFCNICFWYCTMCNAINIANLRISFLPSAT
jgi:hypothetical protein